MNKWYFILAITILSVTVFFSAVPVRAGCGAENGCPEETARLAQSAGQSALDDATEQSGTNRLRSAASKRLNPFAFSNPNDFLARLVNSLVAIIGTLALVFYVWAGFLYMTAQGNAERIDSAKRIFVWTTFGVMGVLLSSFAVQLLFTQLNPVS